MYHFCSRNNLYIHIISPYTQGESPHRYCDDSAFLMPYTIFLIPSHIFLATNGLFIVYRCIPSISLTRRSII